MFLIPCVNFAFAVGMLQNGGDTYPRGQRERPIKKAAKTTRVAGRVFLNHHVSV